jgi:hypothetical protein
MTRKLSVPSLILGACLSAAPSLIIGVLLGNIAPYKNRYAAESKIARKIIASNHDFSGLEIHRASTGEVSFVGSVPSQRAYDELEKVSIDEFGRMNLDYRMQSVEPDRHD